MQGLLDSFAPFIDALSGFSIDSLFAGNLGNTFTFGVVLLTVVGLLQALFGQPLLRVELIIAGIGAGLFLGNLLLGTGMLDSILTESWMHWVLGVIIGLILSGVALALVEYAFFVAAAFAIYPFARTIVSVYLTNNIVNLIVAILVALLVAAISIKFFKTMVVLVTAGLGAYCVSFALSGFLSSIPSIGLILFGVIFLVGVATQSKFALHHEG